MLTNTRRQQLESWQGVRVRLHAEPELSDEEAAYNETELDYAENIERLRATPPWAVEQVALVAVLVGMVVVAAALIAIAWNWRW